jgi:hypothetical protein
VLRGNAYLFIPFHGHSNTLVGRRREQGVCSAIYFYSSTSPRIGATNGTRNSASPTVVPMRGPASPQDELETRIARPLLDGTDMKQSVATDCS